MINELKAKVDLYQECLAIMNLKNLKQEKEFECEESFKELEKLHNYTLKIWTILDEWRS